MELWEITSASGTALNVKTTTTNSSSNSAASEYAKILAEKIASARDDMELMSKIQEELDINEELQEELTGKSGDSSDSGETETIKKFMPDGSILFMTVKDGEIVEQFKKKPHYVAVPDPSAPPTASGDVAVTLKMKPQTDLFSLLM